MICLNILFLHPEDTPWSGEWKDHSWDLVVDLGWAGSACYQRWGQRLKTRVVSLYDFQQPLEVFQKINQLMQAGRNRLLDSRGLDWWEIQAAVSYEAFQKTILLARLKNEVKSGAEIYVTRTSPLSPLLRHLWGKVHYFEPGRPLGKSLRSLPKRLRRLTLPQIVEIACDKWDADHNWRRRWHKRRANSTQPVVLLPSPYINVAKTVVGYANLLPHRKFLLAYTRKSGSWAQPPANVQLTALSAYAVPVGQYRAEAGSLLEKWQRMKREVLPASSELNLASDAGLLDHIPSMLPTGLAVRDAWQCLFEHEPVQAVLCADDMDVYARLPLILARQLGVRTVYCAHGALDSTLIFRQSYADFYLAKGEMERDHLVATCGIPSDSIVLGAPAWAGPSSASSRYSGDREKSIVFFSQPYEVYSGRADEAYREILPALCALAREHGRKVIIKLHPFESRRDCERLIRQTLAATDRPLVEISSHRFASQLFEEAWFGISVNSSVAIECTLARIPFFNCAWLEPPDTGYLAQYSKFAAGQLLHRPADIARIPDMLGEVDLSGPVLKRISQPIRSEDLDRLLFTEGRLEPLSAQPMPAPRIIGKVLRRVVYPTLGGSGYLRRWRDRQTDTLAVVTYHGVVPESYRPERTLLDDGLLHPAAFRRQLRFFKSNYCVIAPQDFREWLLGERELPPRAVLLTCDDGLLNNATEMLPLLLEEDLRCLFFVTGDSLLQKPALAWHVRLYLMLASTRNPLNLDFVETALRLTSAEDVQSTWWALAKELSRHDADRRASLLARIENDLGLAAGWNSIYLEHQVFQQRYAPLNTAGLQRLLESGMTLGAHTLHHPVLTRCPDDICRKEIGTFRDQLETAIGDPVWALAYPFGDAASVADREMAMAEQAGYDCAFLNSGGCIGNAAEQRFALPRLHISSNMEIAEIEALVSGFDHSLRKLWQAAPA